MAKTLYDALQVSPGADFEIIEIAYQTKRSKLIDASDMDSQNAMKALDMAYEILSAPAKRSTYDAKLAMQNVDNSKMASSSARVETEYANDFSNVFMDWWESRKLTMIIVTVTIFVGIGYFLSFKKDNNKLDAAKEAARLEAGNVSKRIDNEERLVSGAVGVANKQEDRFGRELEYRANAGSAIIDMAQKRQESQLQMQQQRIDMEKKRMEIEEARRNKYAEEQRAREEQRKIDREQAYYACVNRLSNQYTYAKAVASCTR